MIGCLTAPFKLLGCLGLLAALALGWMYRDLVLREGRRLLDRGAPASAAEATGRPGIRALKTARAKVDSVAGAQTDSVVLTPAEVASLMGSGLDPLVRRELDSVRVRLLDDEIALLARLRTARLPQQAVGPLAVVLRRTEPIEAAGPIRLTEPGLGEWEVRSLRIRDFPLPADLVPGLLARALGRERAEVVPIRMPAGIVEIRVRPQGATLYGVPGK